MSSLSASGLLPMSFAIAGSEVAMTVESMFSMNSATATISGTRRSRVMGRVLGARGGIGGADPAAWLSTTGTDGRGQGDWSESLLSVRGLRRARRRGRIPSSGPIAFSGEVDCRFTEENASNQ